jgi:hypothetical protein
MSTDKLWFGTYFFVSGERMEHKRDVFTVVDLFSKVGGLTSIISAIFNVIGVKVNLKSLLAEIVQ